MTMGGRCQNVPNEMVNDLFPTKVEESSLKSGFSATVKTAFAKVDESSLKSGCSATVKTAFALIDSLTGKQTSLMTVVDIYFKKQISRNRFWISRPNRFWTIENNLFPH